MCLTYDAIVLYVRHKYLSNNMNDNKNKIKNQLSEFILYTLYESKKILTSYSLQQNIFYESYKIKNIDRLNKEKLLKEKRKLRNAVYYLRKNGFIRINKNNNNNNIYLTKKGLLKSLFFKSKGYKKRKSKKDSFYLLVFDIPEQFRSIRNLFRKILYNFGAERLQKSVFVIKDKQAYWHIKKLVVNAEIKSYVKFIKCEKIINF